MHSKFNYRRAGAAVLVAITVAACAAPASAQVGTPTYPDLRMMSPFDLRLRTRVVSGTTHHYVRFTSTGWNVGEGALELHRRPHVPDDGTADVFQRIYEQPAGFRDEPLGTSPFGTANITFLVPEAARYEVWAERAFTRASADGFSSGAPLYASEDAAYCYADTRPADPDDTSQPRYRCTAVLQGLSPGWTSTFSWLDFTQGVDVGTAPLADGNYVLRNIVDPHNALFESAGKADPSRESWTANDAHTYFSVINGKIAGVES